MVLCWWDNERINLIIEKICLHAKRLLIGLVKNLMGSNKGKGSRNIIPDTTDLTQTDAIIMTDQNDKWKKTSTRTNRRPIFGGGPAGLQAALEKES